MMERQKKMSPPDDDNASRAATQTAIIPDQNQAYASTHAPTTQYDVTAQVCDVTGARCRHPPSLPPPPPPRTQSEDTSGLGREKGGEEKANGKSMVIGRRVLRASRIPTVLTSPPPGQTNRQAGVVDFSYLVVGLYHPVFTSIFCRCFRCLFSVSVARFCFGVGFGAGNRRGMYSV